VPAVDNRAAVDGDDVPVLQDLVTRDAVDHFLVDGSADGGGEPVVAQEVGLGARLEQHGSEDLVELLGGDPRDCRGHGGVEGAAQDEAGLVHGAHLGVGLVFNPWLAECHLRCFLSMRLALPAAGCGARKRGAKSRRPLPMVREEPRSVWN
jgi:hypothetical protein